MGDDQSASLTTYELTGTRISPHRMRVDTGEAEFDVDTDVNPIEYLLGSAVGCLNFTATRVAREMDLDVEGLEATVEGDIDYARFKGEETDARSGLQDVRITLSVDADADDETLSEWLAAVEDRCPVTDTLTGGTGLAVERR
ncbi:osmotically inducible protein OsmC [Halobacteriales archaeon QS_1_68_17]|nr:MAG: osmotically inducible protein OsmC [Halobacteriales archaeon QS_1_68_17]